MRLYFLCFVLMSKNRPLILSVAASAIKVVSHGVGSFFLNKTFLFCFVQSLYV